MGVFDKITDSLTPNEVEEMVINRSLSFGKILFFRPPSTAPTSSIR